MNFKLNFKKYSLIIICIFAGIILLLIGKAHFSENSEKIILNIDGRDYTLLTARTVLQKTRGLSGITELKGADGMIFYYNLPQSPTFWNKNTHFDLELVWMRDGKVIGRDFLPSQDKAGLVAKSPSSVVDWVVELKKL